MAYSDLKFVKNEYSITPLGFNLGDDAGVLATSLFPRAAWTVKLVPVPC